MYCYRMRDEIDIAWVIQDSSRRQDYGMIFLKHTRSTKCRCLHRPERKKQSKRKRKTRKCYERAQPRAGYFCCRQRSYHMIKLRPYQKEAIETVDALPDGSRTIIALATGLGKTVVAANFATNGRILWLSHRDELVRQPERYFAERGMSYGIEKAEEISNGEQVVSASVPSLCKDARLHKFAPDAFDIIVVDEAQHAAAKTYRKILSYFHPRKLVGLTATPKRGDGVRLSDEFDTICFSRDLKWGIQNHYLADITCLRVYGGFSLRNVAMTDGDYAVGDVEEEMKKSENAEIVAKTYQEECVAKDLPTLIYCPTIEICGLVYDAIMKRTPDAEDTVAVLTGQTEADTRAEILRKYQAGEIQCVINCMILTEGTDLPRTACILNNRPTANNTLYQQIIGRGTRLADGKDKCLVIDIVNEDWKEKQICTAPTLFGISPERLNKELLDRLADGETSISTAASDFINAEDPLLAEAIEKSLAIRKEEVDLFAEAEESSIRMALTTGGFTFLARSTENNWKDIDVPEFGDLIVHTTPYEDHLYFIRAGYDGRIYFSKPDVLNHVTVEICGILPSDCISDPIPLPEAVSFASDLLYTHCGTMSYLWSKRARSLSTRSATHNQQAYIERLYKQWLPDNNTSGRDLDQLSLVQASDLIDRKLILDQYRKKATETDKQLADAQKKRKGKILEKWEAKMRAALAEQKKTEEQKKLYWKQVWGGRNTLRQAAEKVREGIRAEEERTRAEQESLKRRLENGEGKDRVFSLSYGYFRESDLKHSASEKQIAFLSSLKNDLLKKHKVVFLHEDALSSCNMPQTGLIIDILLDMNRMPPVSVDRDVYFVYDGKQFADAVSGITRSSQKSSVAVTEYCYNSTALGEKLREEKEAAKEAAKKAAKEAAEARIAEQQKKKEKGQEKKTESASGLNSRAAIYENPDEGEAAKMGRLPKGRYTIYTDGGCDVNPGGKGGAACVIVGSDGNVVRKCSEGYFATTNNRMEMRAVMLGLDQVEPGSEIHLYSDSQYTLNCLSGVWGRKKNADLWRKMDHIISGYSVETTWVRGHDGNEYNEMCDSMCTEVMQHPALTDRGYLADTPVSDKARKRKQKQTRDAALPAVLRHAPENLPKDQFAAKHQINAKCAAGILRFQKSGKKFKDFAALKTFGQDFWSRKKVDFMLQDDPDKDDLLQYLEKVFGEGSPDITKAVRWYKRGLSADDAAHKVKVDKEIAANAMQ